MRIFHRPIFSAALIASLVGVPLLAGCGDSPASSTPPAGDGTGGTGGGAGGDDNPTTKDPVLTVSESRAKVYLGQTVKIDGAAVAPAVSTDIAWTVISAPFGSTITSLQDETDLNPSFRPDLLGQYILQISGRKDGAAASVLVLIEALDAPVFWLDSRIRYEEEAGTLHKSSSRTTFAGGIHGTPERAVNCAANSSPPSDDEEADGRFLQHAMYGAQVIGAGGDVWEAPAGSASRVVFVDSTLSNDRLETRLSVATSQSSCGSPDSRALDTVSMDAKEVAKRSVIQNARFSPSGDRIAYLRDVDGKARLMSIGFDGSGKRELSPFYANGPGGSLNPDAGSPMIDFPENEPAQPLGQLSPRWKDETHVGWVGHRASLPVYDPDDVSWEVYVIEDAPGATAKRVMHCSRSLPTSFDFLPDGSIVATAYNLVQAAGEWDVRFDLLVFRADPTTQECEITRNLTNFSASSFAAADAVLSPDKSQIAFFSQSIALLPLDPNDDVSLVSSLFTVPVDGSSSFKRVPGALEGMQAAGPRWSAAGPRWVAGGTMLTWGAYGQNGGQQLAIPAAGGTTRTLVASSQLGPYELRFVSGIGQGCAVSPGPVGTGFGAISGALGVVALLARRRVVRTMSRRHRAAQS